MNVFQDVETAQYNVISTFIKADIRNARMCKGAEVSAAELLSQAINSLRAINIAGHAAKAELEKSGRYEQFDDTVSILIDEVNAIADNYFSNYGMSRVKNGEHS